MSKKENLSSKEYGQTIYSFKKFNSFIKKEVLSEDANKKLILVKKQHPTGHEGSNYFPLKFIKMHC